MSQQYALFLFVFAVSLSGSLQQANCPEDKYGLNSTMREELYKGLKPMMKSGQLEYKCEFEIAAGLILEDPYKDFEFTQKTNTYPIFFEVEAKDGDTPSSLDEAALKFWNQYISGLSSSRKAAGCSYLLQWGYHKFCCLFDDKA
ncbi:hypothetical protein RB195_013426 [Necator americanus]